MVPPDRLLVMDMTASASSSTGTTTTEGRWDTLCAFLGVAAVPEGTPFPHANVNVRTDHGR